MGITESMEESIVKLRTRVAESRVWNFLASPAPVENTSADYRDDVNWIHPDDEVGSLLLRSVEKDRQLYDWAAERACSARPLLLLRSELGPRQLRFAHFKQHLQCSYLFRRH